MSTFPGYSDDLFAFLGELEHNNNKPWWEANKQRYEDSVRTPSLQLIEAMGPLLADISPHFLAVPKKSGGSMMRPFRDTRFSKDKTPYKTNVGIQFRHRAGKDVHAPGFYLHIETGELFVGVGMWHPDKDSLAAVRASIDSKPKEWLAVRDDPDFAGAYSLGGDSLKRAPKGYPVDHPMIEDLRRKDFIAGAEVDHDFVLADDLPDQLAALFAKAAGFQRWLAQAVGQPF